MMRPSRSCTMYYADWEGVQPKSGIATTTAWCNRTSSTDAPSSSVAALSAAPPRGCLKATDANGVAGGPSVAWPEGVAAVDGRPAVCLSVESPAAQ